MDKFVSKLSLYDILSMVIPGGAIFLFLSLTLGNELKISECAVEPVLGWTIALVLSYLLGLINHVCTAVIWKRFRDNHMLWQKFHWKSVSRYIVVGMIAAIVMPVVGCVLTVEAEVCVFLIPLFFFIIVLMSLIMKDCDNSILRKQYYEKYYYVMKHRYNDDIPIMESQVAFVQNMLIPLALFLFFTPKCVMEWVIDTESCLDKNCFWYMCLLFYGVLLMVIFNRQEKIVYRVKTDYEYLKLLES